MGILAVSYLTAPPEAQSPSLTHTCISFQVKAALDIVSERLSAFTDVGNSCSHVEHILKDLANFEEKSCVRTLQFSVFLV